MELLGGLVGVVRSEAASGISEQPWSIQDGPSSLELHGQSSVAVICLILDPPSYQFQDRSDHVCFISPKVTQFIKCTGNPAGITMLPEPLDLSNKELLFLAINDNSNHTARGIHWSLLVYLQDKNGFFHYDSYGTKKLEALSGRKGNKLASMEEKVLNKTAITWDIHGM
ncbi:hypothetical protein FD755_007267 [Muntiacus reevesi]|uniref:Ubiquitin-like protease family profile domain-containing protein n=1 Tax=Muntiacus reevesi TaxID=9886 RepID=A0A5J5MGZ7_MUNRE|nr:hypothetical protein FD755_007267 [Muntiacus reevesi]